jgi:Family of unknown function (DUF5989)
MRSLLFELWLYTKARKKYWLLPFILLLLALGVITIVTESSSIAPFIYAIW